MMVTLSKIKAKLEHGPYPDFWHITYNDKQIQININDSIVFFLQPAKQNVQLTDGGWNLMTLPKEKRAIAFEALQQNHFNINHQMITMTIPLNQLDTRLKNLIQVFTDIGYDDLNQATPKIVNQWFDRLENAIDNLDLADDLSLESINQLTHHQQYRAQNLINNLKTFTSTIEGDLKSR